MYEQEFNIIEQEGELDAAIEAEYTKHLKEEE